MLKKDTTYKVFRDFKRLDNQNHHSIVQFCEEHQKAIEELNDDEYFEIQVSYVNALFEIEAYHKHIKVAKGVIELSIIQNIQFINNEDVYLKMLYQKAISNLYTENIEQAIHISKELIKLEPQNKEYISLLNRCYMQDGLVFLHHLRTAGVLLFFLSIGIFIIKILIVEYFFQGAEPFVQILNTSTLILGSILLLAGLSIHRIKAYHQVNIFLKSLKKARKSQ